MWIAIIASFLIAALSGMGVGGGGLFVIYLALWTDTPQLAAQGMNLLFFLFSAGASITVHLQQRKIYFVAVGLMAAAGIVGALLGARLSTVVDQVLLRRIFGTLLIISGIFALQKRDKPRSGSDGSSDGTKA